MSYGARPVVGFARRLRAQDLGVAAVVAGALVLGLLLFSSVVGRSSEFQDPNSSFRMRYPAGWLGAQTLQDAVLAVQDPQAQGAYKTTVLVEEREIDPQSSPTLQTLVDRRVAQRATLNSYRFLANRDATVGGERAAELEYAYVVQPIDEPRRASLPVVVHAREYIVIAADRSYYITLNAPEHEWPQASQRFNQMIESVQVTQ